MPSLRFKPVSGQVDITLPGSKSHSNRLLILRALSGKSIQLSGLSEARDTRILNELLQKITAVQKPVLELDCQDAGTVYRFLMAFCALTPGQYRLFGTQRLMERPITELVEALVSLGASIVLKQDGWHIQGKALEGGFLALKEVKSSQFVSALLLCAPLMKNGLHLEWKGEKGSWPYVAMSLQALTDFGVSWEQNGDEIRVNPGFHSASLYTVERDWSSAAFFFPFLANREDLTILFPDLRLHAGQGDAFVERLFRYEGMHASEGALGLALKWKKPEWSLNALSVNLASYPDLAPPVLVYYLMQKREVHFSGLESLALKESVRDAVLAEAVKACGGQFKSEKGWWQLRAETISKPGLLHTYSDHRMAMAFSLLALQFGEVELSEIASVDKSFPTFWQEAAKLGLTLS